MPFVRLLLRSERGLNRKMSLYTVFFRMKRLWQQVLNLIYPDTRTTCALCQRPIGPLQSEGSSLSRQLDVSEQQTENKKAYTLQGVCLFCLQDAALFSYRRWNGRLHLYTDSEKQTVIPVLCAATYEGIIRDAIRHWKYDGQVEFTGYLAHLVVDAVHESESGTGGEWDMLTCVPTSTDRLKKRGYHHVGLLLEEVAAQLELPFQELLVRRQNSADNPGLSAADKGFTQSQTAKSAVDRRQSLKGQFALRPDLRPDLRTSLQPDLKAGLTGKSILLVDDVVTTGATLEACAKVLIESGAKQVRCVAIAHVE